MPLNSVNTNSDASLALQELNSTNSQISSVQTEISTGYAISSPTNNGAIWAIAQGQRAQVSALSSVSESLQRGQSAIDVALSAGQQISDLLNQIKSNVLSAADASQNTTSRAQLNNQFKSLLAQITTVINNANFNGVNLLQSGAANYTALANVDRHLGHHGAGRKPVARRVQHRLSATSSYATASPAQAYLTAVDTAITNVNTALGQLGTGSNALTSQLNFVNNLSSTLNTGIGNLVDADMAQASAQLQALQTKQQLGVQALSIANGESSNLLTLFRNIS